MRIESVLLTVLQSLMTGVQSRCLINKAAGVEARKPGSGRGSAWDLCDRELTDPRRHAVLRAFLPTFCSIRGGGAPPLRRRCRETLT